MADDFGFFSSSEGAGAEEDPAAAFLAQQESEIAGIENDEGFGPTDGDSASTPAGQAAPPEPGERRAGRAWPRAAALWARRGLPPPWGLKQGSAPSRPEGGEGFPSGCTPRGAEVPRDARCPPWVMGFTVQPRWAGSGVPPRTRSASQRGIPMACTSSQRA